VKFLKTTSCFGKKWSFLPQEQTIFSLYKRYLSPLLQTVFFGGGCRFTPTCSVYTRDAFRKYGFLKGGWMSVWRILRCHPWSGANPIDPVQ